MLDGEILFGMNLQPSELISKCCLSTPGNSDIQNQVTTGRDRMRHINRVTYVKHYYNYCLQRPKLAKKEI